MFIVTTTISDITAEKRFDGIAQAQDYLQTQRQTDGFKFGLLLYDDHEGGFDVIESYLEREK